MQLYAVVPMFAARRYPRLATMSEIDAAPLNWSDLGVSELVPTGTVTLLLADPPAPLSTSTAARTCARITSSIWAVDLCLTRRAASAPVASRR